MEANTRVSKCKSSPNCMLKRTLSLATLACASLLARSGVSGVPPNSPVENPSLNIFIKLALACGSCRVNTINGLTYKNDPAVFSWNIVNEPRCSSTGATDGSCTSGIQGFIDSMASFIKGVDKNHMVSLFRTPSSLSSQEIWELLGKVPCHSQKSSSVRCCLGLALL